MKFMNEWEIQMAVERTAHRPIQNRAARFLAAFKDEVNAHSDGWAYWRQPVNAAYHLMLIVEGAYPESEHELKKAISKIKAFYTRRGNAAGMTFPEVF